MTDRTVYSVTPPPWVRERLDEIYNWVQDLEDTATRADAAGAVIQMIQEELEQPLAELRAGDMRLLKAEGWSYSSLSEAFGLSRGRLHQIVGSH